MFEDSKGNLFLEEELEFLSTKEKSKLRTIIYSDIDI